jgi:hypothetical protein
VWEQYNVGCRLTQNLCREKPPSSHGNTFLKSLQRIEFKREKTYQEYEKETAYTIGSYVCSNGYKFKDLNSIGFKSFYGSILAYKNVTCIGAEQWEPVPLCVFEY